METHSINDELLIERMVQSYARVGFKYQYHFEKEKLLTIKPLWWDCRSGNLVSTGSMFFGKHMIPISVTVSKVISHLSATAETYSGFKLPSGHIMLK